MSRDIPVYLEGKHIEMTEEVPHIIERMYKRWHKIYRVKKVYHTRGKRIDMENKFRPPYSI